MQIGFKELWKTIQTQRGEYNFLRRAFTNQELGIETGREIFPRGSPYLIMAVNDLAEEMRNAYLIQTEEKRKAEDRAKAPVKTPNNLWK